MLRIWREKSIYPSYAIDEMEEIIKGNKPASSSGTTQTPAAQSQPTSSSYQQQQGGKATSYNNQPPPEPAHYGGGGGGFHAVVSTLSWGASSLVYGTDVLIFIASPSFAE